MSYRISNTSQEVSISELTSLLRYLKLTYLAIYNANFWAKTSFSIPGVAVSLFLPQKAIAIRLSDRNNPDKMGRPETVSGVDSVDTFLVRSRAERMKEVHGASGEPQETQYASVSNLQSAVGKQKQIQHHWELE